MISLTDEQDIKAAFNLCFMKHKIIDSEEEIQKLEDTKLKSLGQTSKYPNAEAKPSAQEIRKKEEYTVNLQLGLKRKAVQVEAMYVAQAAKPHEVEASYEQRVRAKAPNANENEDLNEGIDVMTYDLAGKEYPMKFRTWVSKIHVLTAGWKAFRKDHKLVENQHWVTVWMFRNIATGKLCFVIEVRKLPVFDAIKRRRTRQN
ncbi:hypothetical protein ACLB2K_001947 [Fragaria x ananassa]